MGWSPGTSGRPAPHQSAPDRVISGFATGNEGKHLLLHTLPLGADNGSPGEARLFVSSWARSWGYQALITAAALLTSELVTNALVHASEPFSIAVANTGRGIRVAVSDASPQAPVVRADDEVDVHGRGLRLVAVISSGWGVEPGPVGKRVWFELHVADTHRPQLD